MEIDNNNMTLDQIAKEQAANKPANAPAAQNQQPANSKGNNNKRPNSNRPRRGNNNTQNNQNENNDQRPRRRYRRRNNRNPRNRGQNQQGEKRVERAMNRPEVQKRFVRVFRHKKMVERIYVPPKGEKLTITLNMLNLPNRDLVGQGRASKPSTN